MHNQRISGILLHPTSLPGPDGIGDLGPGAYSWIDFLFETRTGLWQVLPLNPTSYGDSPYQSFSVFAGNHFLISSEKLLEDGLLMGENLADRPEFSQDSVAYGPMIEWKLLQLNRAFDQFQEKKILEKEFKLFKIAQEAWLEDYALFMALKDIHGGRAWVEWDSPFRDRDAKALSEARKEYADAVEAQRFWQFLFYRQWHALREYAQEKGVRIIGDVPIYVAHDSSDVWANQALFYLDGGGNPTVVAGVPPDYFSETGQLWGNPIYKWDLHKGTKFAWWVSRIEAVLDTVDVIRLDHFRGFAGYWEVPAGEETAMNGRWVAGPGNDLFYALRDHFGELPIIAEDLGEITNDVHELRDRFSLPGMKVLQFGFVGEPDHYFLPHTYPQHCVAYTGTHDNQTALGWYQSATEDERDQARRYLSSSGEDFGWDMLRALWASQADTVVAQMQDLLSLDDTARMNFPGTLGGNWSWRLRGDALSSELIEKFRGLNQDYGRGV